MIRDCNAKYGFFNLVDQSSTDITASSENAQFPAANIKEPFSTKVFRSQDTTSAVNVVFDFKTTENVDTIMFRPNQKTGWGHVGDLTIEANFIDSWASPPYSTTITPDYDYSFASLLLDTAETYRFWRISGTGSPYFELSNIFIGERFDPSKNIQLGWSYDRKDLSKKSSNLNGQTFITQYESKVSIQADIKVLTSSEFELLNQNVNYVGISKPVWQIIDPENKFTTDEDLFSGVYYFKNRPKFSNIAFGYFDTRFELEECK